MILTCMHSNIVHTRATAAYYGQYSAKIKRDHQLDGDEDMLYVAMARFERVVRGQAICGFHMRAVAEAFDSGENSCFSEEDPIQGVGCSSTKKYTHPICGTVSRPHLMNHPYNSKIVVSYIGPSAFTISAFHMLEQLGISTVVIATSNGLILKGNVDQRRLYSYNNLLDGNENEAAVSSPLTMDKNGSHIYFVIKNKVVKYPLYSCSPHLSCARCVVNGRNDPLDCGWCNGRCTRTTECEDSTSFRKDSCPPDIQEVTYEYSSAKKGTVFTISGYSLGSYINPSYNNVTLSDLDCEVEIWNNTQVTCTLTTPLRSAPTHTLRLSSSNLPLGNESLKISGSDSRELNMTKYRFPKLYAMYPSKGPASGGTHVIIYGENLDTHDHVVINVRRRRCIEMAINNYAAWCITDGIESPELKDTIAFQFGDHVLELEESVPGSFNMTGKYRNFVFLPDPQIYQIRPGITTISGLMNVTVVGRHLDSVETPELVVRVALSQSENVLEFKEECWSDPDSKGRNMTCRTPPLRHAGLPLPTRSFPLVTHVAFLMDGVEELKNLPRTRQVMSRLMYYPDPEITPFSGTMKILDNETLLEIKGRHLDLIENPDNLHVRIDGHEMCKIISLHPNSLQCELPAMLLSNSSVFGYNFSVEVIVGVSVQNVGIMTIVEREGETSAWILVAIFGGLCVLVGIMICCFWRYKKPTKKTLEDLTLQNRNETGNRYTRQTDGIAPTLRSSRQESAPTSPCEVPLIAEARPLVEQETLQLIQSERLLIEPPLLIVGKKIGSGQFGCVYEGLLQRPKDGTKTKVAVKTLRNLNPVDGSEKIAAFMEEALAMKDLKHENVISLIGISFEEGLPLVVLPYMENGDLCTYIRDPNREIIMKAQLLEFAIDVATGMTYLAKIRFVHRDLAARNCVLDANLVAKVADFGLSRDIYEKDYYSSQDNKIKLPCKWMAPESMEKGLYSEATDVWSYGVLLWELMTRGVIPYANVIGWDVLPYVKSGRRLPHPNGCPEALYAVMHECWKEDPNERPCFEKIRDCVIQISTELIEESNAKPTPVANNPGYL